MARGVRAHRSQAGRMTLGHKSQREPGSRLDRGRTRSAIPTAIQSDSGTLRLMAHRSVNVCR